MTFPRPLHRRVSLACWCWLALALLLAVARPAVAQTTRPPGRPIGRISFYTDAVRLRPDEGPAIVSGDVITAVQFELPDGEDNRLEYRIDMRRTSFIALTRPTRTSVYDGYIGARFADGRARIRAGQMWLTDLGGLGSVAGGLVEYRQHVPQPGGSRLRIAGFGGVEPNPYGMSHAQGVTKFGGYAALEAGAGRRHTLGYVHIRRGGLVERSVITGSNFLRAGSRIFLYQMAEYDLSGPAGLGKGGLNFVMINAHASATDRLDLQGIFHRGRSIDTRAIADDVLNGRTIRPGALDGLLFESTGGRVTVRVRNGLRVNAGYTRDRNNHDSASTGRFTVGASLTNLARAGIDVTISNSRIDRPTGRYNSLYVSTGRSFGSALYVSGDYSSSVSILRFTRSDGLTIETRPRTRQIGASGVMTLSRSLSLTVTGERTRDDSTTDVRVLSGLTVRFR